MNILFICTGNTCRSPMAEAICKKKMRKLKISGNADSCGTAAVPNMPATENAVLAVKELYNLNISKHLSKPLSVELIDEADVIFVMSQRHTIPLISLFPECKDKLYIPKNEIADPYMSSLEVYKDCAKELEEAIDDMLSKVRQNG